MSASISPMPGIFFVNSKIIEPTLTPEAYHKWYNEVHVPDILKTSGIESAYRYYAITPEQTENPYLALYPLKDVNFLESKEFHSIPVSSDLLPRSGNSFDLAEFDARPSILVKAFENEKTIKGTDLNLLIVHPIQITEDKGPAPIIVVLSFDIPSKDVDVDKTIREHKLPFLTVKDGVRRTTLYKTHFTMRNSLPQKGKPVPKYFALVELESLERVDELEKFQDLLGAQVTAFKLLKASGIVEHVYYR